VTRWRLTSPVVKLTENDVELACLQVLTIKRYWYAKLHAGTFKSADGLRWLKGVPKGTPDYTVHHGRHRGFLLEVKRPGGRLSPDQEVQIAMIRRQFGLPIAVVSTVEELAAWLAEHERSP